RVPDTRSQTGLRAKPPSAQRTPHFRIDLYLQEFVLRASLFKCRLPPHDDRRLHPYTQPQLSRERARRTRQARHRIRVLLRSPRCDRLSPERISPVAECPQIGLWIRRGQNRARRILRRLPQPQQQLLFVELFLRILERLRQSAL